MPRKKMVAHKQDEPEEVRVKEIWPVECKCNEKNKPHVHWTGVSGHCDPATYAHGRCRGAYSSGQKVVCCECPCHRGEEPPLPATRTKAVTSDGDGKPKAKKRRKKAASK